MDQNRSQNLNCELPQKQFKKEKNLIPKSYGMYQKLISRKCIIALDINIYKVKELQMCLKNLEREHKNKTLGKVVKIKT